MSAYDDLVCEAIGSMRLLVVEYAGTSRRVEPHVLGDDALGDRLLSAYQVSGGSASGASRGWKSFRMSRVVSLSVSEERFHAARPDYRRDDGAFVRIVCQLAG